MRQTANLLAVPASLLIIISGHLSQAGAAATSEQWPYYLPDHVKYWPEEAHRSGDLESFQRQLHAPKPPAAVRKMGTDEGEKFFMEYWEHDGQPPSEDELALNRDAVDVAESGTQPRTLFSEQEEDELAEYADASTLLHYKPALLLHTDHQTSLDPNVKDDASYDPSLHAHSPRAALAALRKRAFECPRGTNNCSAIGRSGSCCSQGEVCQIIPDTEKGSDVGCCPEGKACSGSLGKCDTGYTKCSDEIGGGCCIPLYTCVDEGCAPGPSLISVTPTVTTKVSKPPTSSVSRSSTSSLSSSTASHATAVSCSSGFRSCPASLGGGCCRTDRECGTSACLASSSASTSAPASTSSVSSKSSSNDATPIAPVRPTSGRSPPASTVSGTACPTGFYQCNAYYHGGCCRVGRNCGLTSCPTSASTSVVTRDGVTIVVPAGSGGTSPSTPSAVSASPTLTSPASGTTTTTASMAGSRAAGAGACASGWSSCAASVSGGCCPSGYSCAISNCVAGAAITASGIGGGDVGKIAPSAGSKAALVDWRIMAAALWTVLRYIW